MLMMAAAPSAALRSDSRAVFPPTLQKMPFFSVGMAPSTTSRYLPKLAFMESCSDFSAWWPEPTIRVSW